MSTLLSALQALLNEKIAPEILEYQADLVQEVTAALTQQVGRVRLHAWLTQQQPGDSQMLSDVLTTPSEVMVLAVWWCMTRLQPEVHLGALVLQAGSVTYPFVPLCRSSCIAAAYG